MINPIPNNIAKLWENWNIRGVILLSLSMQIFLIMSSPLRKRVQNRLVLSSIWAAYLLADWAANFCVGLIASSQISSIKTNIRYHSDLLAFWAPFLLMHLGGPDTITAFALEDNELWLRHLLGFIIQVISCVYVFLLTMPKNALWIPTVLVFLAGMIKYGERTYALYLASYDTFRESMNGKPNPGSIYLKLVEKANNKAKPASPSFPVTASLQLRLEKSNNEAKPASPSVTITDNNDHEIHKHAAKQEQLSNVEVVLKAYGFFDKFKGIIVDIISSSDDLTESREYFYSLSSKDALRVIEVELNFFYEAFYTKFLVVRNRSGYLFRFVAISCVAIAFRFFFTVDKHEKGFYSFEVRVTYALLCGAMALDTMALLMLLFSDRTIASLHHSCAATILNCFLRLKTPKWLKCHKKPYTNFMALSTCFLFRRWNGSILGFNLISYSYSSPKKKKTTPPVWMNVVQPIKSRVLNYCKYCSLVMWLHEVNIPLLAELWEFIFNELKTKSAKAEDVERICNSRGGWVLQKEEIKNLMQYVDVNEVAFDESLIMWHIATHLLYTEESDGHDDVGDECEREFSKLLSDYMLYLLVVQTKIISALAGIGQKRFQDTLAEATQFFQDIMDSQFFKEIMDKYEATQFFQKMDVKACKRLLEVPTDYKPIDVRGDASKSLLFDACILAKELKKLEEKKWRIISLVWVELLSFAACNCRVSAHVQHLSKGGELISLVWLLMVHLGVGKQFQIKG